MDGSPELLVWFQPQCCWSLHHSQASYDGSAFDLSVVELRARPVKHRGLVHGMPSDRFCGRGPFHHGITSQLNHGLDFFLWIWALKSYKHHSIPNHAQEHPRNYCLTMGCCRNDICCLRNTLFNSSNWFPLIFNTPSNKGLVLYAYLDHLEGV